MTETNEKIEPPPKKIESLRIWEDIKEKKQLLELRNSISEIKISMDSLEDRYWQGGSKNMTQLYADSKKLSSNIITWKIEVK